MCVSVREAENDTKSVTKASLAPLSWVIRQKELRVSVKKSQLQTERERAMFIHWFMLRNANYARSRGPKKGKLRTVTTKTDVTDESFLFCFLNHEQQYKSRDFFLGFHLWQTGLPDSEWGFIHCHISQWPIQCSHLKHCGEPVWLSLSRWTLSRRRRVDIHQSVTEIRFPKCHLSQIVAPNLVTVYRRKKLTQRFILASHWPLNFWTW